jgi:metal-responsive CopG/Arc/MetJ family transcriptional regulator
MALGRQVSLRLPDRLVKSIDRRARESGTTRSEIVRHILERTLDQSAAVRDRPYDRVQDLVGSVSGAPTDLGARHREYLVRLVRDRRG